MASAYSKRLSKLEELLAARINAPLAFIWMHAGESREEACARCGYDPAMVNRLRFVRWLTEEEATADPPLDAWAEPGPPGEDVCAGSGAGAASKGCGRSRGRGAISDRGRAPRSRTGR